MSNLFRIDGKIYELVEKFVDCILVSILWTLFSLPIVTIGASTAALYYTVHKVIRNDTGKLWQTFWYTFKSNFRQATALWGILFIILAVLCFDCYLVYTWRQINSLFIWLFWILLILLASTIMLSSYWFAYITHIQDSIKTVLKNTFIMCVVHFSKSILLLLITILVIACFVLLPFSPFFFILLPGFSMYLACPILQKVFLHYWDILT